MRFTATHPDVADCVVIDTEDADSARMIAAEQFAEQVGSAVDIVLVAVRPDN